VTCADDVLELYGIASTAATPVVGPTTGTLLEGLQGGARRLTSSCARRGIGPARVAAALVELELRIVLYDGAYRASV
jgi:hypothetical protein